MLEIRVSFLKHAENFLIAHPNRISPAQTVTQDARNVRQRSQKCFRQREAAARQKLPAYVQRQPEKMLNQQINIRQVEPGEEHVVSLH